MSWQSKLPDNWLIAVWIWKLLVHVWPCIHAKWVFFTCLGIKLQMIVTGARDTVIRSVDFPFSDHLFTTCPWMKWGLAHMLLIHASATHMPQVPPSDYVTDLKMVSGYLLDIFVAVPFMSLILAKALEFYFKRDWAVISRFWSSWWLMSHQSLLAV